MIYLNNFLFDFIQIWCIILLKSYVVPSWSCVGLVILTKVSHLQFSRCDFLHKEKTVGEPTVFSLESSIYTNISLREYSLVINTFLLPI